MENDKSLTVRQNTALAKTSQQMVQRIQERINMVQHVVKSIMRDGSDFGKIPGCGDKPALMKPGAEKLSMAFMLVPSFRETITELPNGHREVKVCCTIASNTGEILGEGLGSCSTMESKYRYRNVSDYEVTGDPIPKDAKEKKQEYRRQGLGMKQINGVWEWVKYRDSVRSENPDIADTYNTVLKMAKKRAHIDATLTVLGCSDMFTQDIDERLDAEIERRASEQAEQKAPTNRDRYQKIVDTARPDQLIVIRAIEKRVQESENAPLVDFSEAQYGKLIDALKAYKPAAPEQKAEERKAA